ncbi:MAG: hypothetical protein LUF90_03595 [Rikenellaceae bacterium]|nr:hypothetical protein [Rikenellaceae bacterium]
MMDGTFGRTIERAPDRDGPTGRIKFGTESNGGFKNITITNCTFDRCRGLAIETVDGGVIEDVVVNNIAMRDISNFPIYIRLGNRARGPEESTPVARIRRVSISNLTVKNADCRYASIIAGIPGHPVEDIFLSNINIEYKGGLTIGDAANQPEHLVNNFFTRNEPNAPRDPFDVPERIKDYPEPSTMGILPAYGFFVRHAKDVEMHNVKVTYMEEDTRVPYLFIDVDGLTFSNVKGQSPEGTPVFHMKKVLNFVPLTPLDPDRYAFPDMD